MISIKYSKSFDSNDIIKDLLDDTPSNAESYCLILVHGCDVESIVPKIYKKLGIPGIGSHAGYAFTDNVEGLKTSAAIIFFDNYVEHGELSCLKNKSDCTIIAFSHNDENLENTLKSIECVGGLASDDWTFDRQVVFLDDKIICNGSIGMQLNQSLTFQENLAWVKLEGAKGIVTKFKNNRLYEVDSRPAVDFYHKNVGEMQLYGAFPLQTETKINRTVVGGVFEDGSLLMTGDIPEGTKVNLLTVDAQVLEGSAKDMITSLSKKTTDSAIVFSCLARQMMLGNRSNCEQKVIGKIIDRSITCYLYGEFIPTGNGSTILQNQYIVGVGI